jgi:hypothetical protein
VEIEDNQSLALFKSMTNLEVIGTKLDQMAERQSETSESVKRVHEALQHPEIGIYSRIKDAESRTLRLEEWMEEHEASDERLRVNVEKISKTMKPLTDDYTIRMSNKKWTDRILWTIIAVILGIMVPVVWKTFTSTPDTIEKKK